MVPDWVLNRVVASTEDDWRLYEEGWINESEAMRTANPGLSGVYVSQSGALCLLPAIASPLVEVREDV